MTSLNKRATIYFDPDIHQSLKIKAATMSLSVSELVDRAVRLELKEDEEDLRTFNERKNESSLSYEDVLKHLRVNGKI